MEFVETKLAGFIKKHPKKFFLIIPVLTGYAVFFSYAIQNGFFLSLDSKLLALMFMVGMALSLFLLGIHCSLKYILSKGRIPECIKCNLPVIFVIGAIIFGTSILPGKIVKSLGLGNYTGTLIFKPEAAQVFSNFPKKIVKSNNTVNNLHVVWSYGNRFFIRVPDENKQYILMDINSNFVYNILRKSEKQELENSFTDIQQSMFLNSVY